MQSIICLLLAIGAAYVRVPEKTVTPAIESRNVWVFFTDKGIYNEADYGAAVNTLSRHAAELGAARRPALASACSRYHSWATMALMTALVPVQIEARPRSRTMRSIGKTLV